MEFYDTFYFCFYWPLGFNIATLFMIITNSLSTCLITKMSPAVYVCRTGCYSLKRI